jgi:hypothetical protein
MQLRIVAAFGMVLAGCSSAAGTAPSSDSGSSADAASSGGADGPSMPLDDGGGDSASPDGGGSLDAGALPHPTADGGADTGTGIDAGPSKWWMPAKNTSFYWDLQNAPPDNTKNVGAYDIDGWNNTAAEVAALHALGIRVVCYMDVGSFEPNRPDSSMFPASLKGAAVVGWPGELWLDARPSGPNYTTLQSIMRARFAVCQSKGFDAVEPDNMESYTNSPGFPTTAADQLAYNEWVAQTIHGLGLAAFQKNDLAQIPSLVGYFDGILDEECNYYSECSALAPYLSAGKPAWNAEYTQDGETTAKFCGADVSSGIVGALFSVNLDGSLFQPCSNDVGKIN